MKNIPLFTTMHGVASIILEGIPFNKTAYIRIQTSSDPALLCSDCIDFCRAAGAETIYAMGHSPSRKTMPDFTIIRMKRDRITLPLINTQLVAVDKENFTEFRRLYNQRMKEISAVSYVSVADLNNLLKKNNGYFIYQDAEMIGIGIADEVWIRTIISLKPGKGEAVLLSLNTVLEGNEVCVELVDNNLPAKRLYERMGFQYYETVSEWYKIY